MCQFCRATVGAASTGEGPTMTEDLPLVIARSLLDTGQFMRRFLFEDERDEIRKAGRTAGRILGRPIRTAVVGEQMDHVIVLLMDYGAEPIEEAMSEARSRIALERVFDELPGDDDPEQPGN